MRKLLHTPSLLRIVTLFAVLASTINLQAQFSGPARSSDEEVNQAIQITTDPAILFPAQREIRLTAGDGITVAIFGVEEYKGIDKVSVDGYIRLPLIGAIPVAGLSPHEAERLIAAKLDAAGMFHNPQVTLNITDSPNQFVTVIGETHSVVPTIVPKRLYDVLAASGGLPITASHIITIHRIDVKEPIIVDLGNDPAKSAMADVPVFPGDTVVVGRVGNVYVIGSVKQQAAIPLTQTNPITVLQALATAGGLPFEAKLNDTKIIRTLGNRRVIIAVPVKKIMQGTAADPILQSDDILIVPTSAMRAFIRNNGLNTIIGLATAFVYVSTVN